MLHQINVQDIVSIARRAGAAIMQVYQGDFDVRYKEDGSPLTLADRRANNIIDEGLSQLPVSFPILSEEGGSVPYEVRRRWEYFWLIDPLDGTKEFTKKNGEFTVNIALIHKDTPVLGVVYAPALDVCYWAKKDNGAFKDGQRLPIEIKSQVGLYKIVVSRSHMSNDTQNFINSIDVGEKELVSIGSSLKICLVAEGEANVYPRLAPTMEWDTGAAHAIVNESGAFLQRYDGGHYFRHRYNKPSLLNEWFVAYRK